VTFEWDSTHDVGCCGNVTYTVKLYKDSSCAIPYKDLGTTSGTSLTTTLTGIEDGTYYWSVVACDGAGNCIQSDDCWEIKIMAPKPPEPPPPITRSSTSIEIKETKCLWRKENDEYIITLPNTPDSFLGVYKVSEGKLTKYSSYTKIDDRNYKIRYPGVYVLMWKIGDDYYHCTVNIYQEKPATVPENPIIFLIFSVLFIIVYKIMYSLKNSNNRKYKN